MKIKKVIVIGHDNFGSREIFTRLVSDHPDIKFYLFITTGLYYKKTFLQSIIKLLREASFLFCFHRFIEMMIFRLKGDTLGRRAKNWNIPVFFTADINGVNAHRQIQRIQPDIIFSTFTMHILKPKTIDMANVKTIGCHPSILPDYRGLEVFFWALANGETDSGVSVFYLSANIDAGTVIMQEKFEIDDNESVNSIYAKLTGISGALLSQTLQQYKENRKFAIIPSPGKGRYFPMPTRDALKRFHRLKKKWR